MPQCDVSMIDVMRLVGGVMSRFTNNLFAFWSGGDVDYLFGRVGRRCWRCCSRPYHNRVGIFGTERQDSALLVGTFDTALGSCRQKLYGAEFLGGRMLLSKWLFDTAENTSLEKRNRWMCLEQRYNSYFKTIRTLSQASRTKSSI